MSEAENEGKQGVYVYANLIDANGDGKIDMISFVDPNGRAVALAVDNDHTGLANNIHVFQDVTETENLMGRCPIDSQTDPRTLPANRLG